MISKVLLVSHSRPSLTVVALNSERGILAQDNRPIKTLTGNANVQTRQVLEAVHLR